MLQFYKNLMKILRVCGLYLVIKSISIIEVTLKNATRFGAAKEIRTLNQWLQVNCFTYWNYSGKMVVQKGFEPLTARISAEYSTVELLYYGGLKSASSYIIKHLKQDMVELGRLELPPDTLPIEL